METAPASNNSYFLHVSFAILVISILIRFVYVSTAIIDNPIRADAKKYATIASNLVTYGTYSHLSGKNPEASGMITPGYPLLLALVKSIFHNPQTEYATVLYLQALLSGLTAFIAFLIAAKVFPLWGAALTGTIMALSPHQIVFSGYMLTETLFTFLLFGAIYGLIISLKKIKPGRFFILGILFGLAAWVRPAVLLFPLFITPFIWFCKPGRKTGSTLGLMLLGLLIVWLPWNAWKSVVGHPEKGTNLAAASFAYGSYPDLVYDGAKHVYPDEKIRRAVSYKEDPDYLTMSNKLDTAFSITVTRAAKDPFKYLKWYLYGKPVMFWAWNNNMSLQGGPFVYPVIRSVYNKAPWAKASFQVIRFLHPILIVMAILSIFLLVYKIFYKKENTTRNTILFIIVLFPIYYTMVHVFLLPLPRYAIPAHGFAYIAGLFVIITILARLYDYVLLTKRGQKFNQWLLNAVKQAQER